MVQVVAGLQVAVGALLGVGVEHRVRSQVAADSACSIDPDGPVPGSGTATRSGPDGDTPGGPRARSREQAAVLRSWALLATGSGGA